jgi:hypothetical protein
MYAIEGDYLVHACSLQYLRITRLLFYKQVIIVYFATFLSSKLTYYNLDLMSENMQFSLQMSFRWRLLTF